MKKFYEISKPAIVVGVIAGLLFALDRVLATYVWSEYDSSMIRGFVWITFLIWPITFGMKNKERISMWICHMIGFLIALGMIHAGQMFSVTVLGIDIAVMIGVAVFSGLAMYCAHLGRFWLNSILGIFVGAALTFSGLGIGIWPDNAADGAMMLPIILFYSLLGCLAAWTSVFLISRWGKKTESEATTENPSDEAESAS